MPLTDTAIRKMKPVERDVKLADSLGLYLHAKPTGLKAWRMNYRFLGTRKTLTFGQYPAVSLVDAREMRDGARKLLAKGIDPGVQKKADRQVAEVAMGNTFGLLADEFLQRMRDDGRAEPTMTKNTWMLKELSKPLADRPVSEISAAEVLEVLRKIEKSGRTETALATRAAIGRVFRYAISSARAANDPTSALRGALRRHVAVSHPAIVKAEDVGGLMKAVWGYDGWPTLGAVLRMQALVFARPSETRTMEWNELDLDAKTWTIPEHKAKMRRPHDVPLSRQAIEVIESMREFKNAKPFVFPSMMSGKDVLSENSMNSALRRMGIRKDQHTAHGFRSTASTLLNGSKKFDKDWIEAQLAHQDQDKVRRIYNRAEYWDERVEMMQWWGDYVEGLLKA